MKFLVCLMFFLVTAGFASGQSVQGVHSCSVQGPPGLPGRDGRDGRDCPCGTKDAEIDELQRQYRELEQRLSDLENRTETTSMPGPGAITLISHDSEARTHVNGFENPGSYSKDVTYWNSMEQVRAVVDQASSCKQHIKYECHGSVIWSGITPYAWWVTWDGRQADYWGGASPGSGKCACGETGACSGSCYCDANDLTWREDSGFLSHKNDLPVTQLRFGDTGGSQEDGYYTLGKLICYP